MRRIVLLLVIISIGMLFVVLKSPAPVSRTSPSEFDPIAAAKQKAPSPNVRKKRNPAAFKPASLQQPSLAESAGTESLSNPPAAIAEANDASRLPARSAVERNRSLVASDSVPLYSVNSIGGTILNLLARGTTVEVSFEMIDAKDSWALVRVPEMNLIGFIRTRDLEFVRSRAQGD